MLLEMDACHTYLHVNMSVTLERAGIDIGTHKYVRNVDCLESLEHS